MFGIEAVQAGVLVGGVDYLPGNAVQSGRAGMGQPLRLGQVGFACPQLGGPLGHVHLQLVPGLAELFFGPHPLVDEGRALECRRSVIRGQAEQKLVDLRGEAERDHRPRPPALAIDTDGDDDTAIWLDAAADVGNDLHA